VNISNLGLLAVLLDCSYYEIYLCQIIAEKLLSFSISKFGWRYSLATTVRKASCY